MTPISTQGAHSIVSNNNINQAGSDSSETPTATPTDSNSPSPTATSAIPEYMPWTLLALLLAGSVLPLMFRKKLNKRFPK